MSEIKNILKKMQSVMAAVDRIEKDKRNDNGRYDYASEKAIKETLHPLLVEHGIIFMIDCHSPRTIELQAPKDSQAPVPKLMALDVNYRFYDVDSGECVDGRFVGSGNGRDDKGIYAAMTGAIKYILTSSFLIPTGDDPEDNKYDRNEKPDDFMRTPPRPATPPTPSAPPQKKAETAPPPKSKKDEEEPLPITVKPSETDRIFFPFDQPDGSPIIPASEVEKIVGAFNKFGMSKEALEQCAQFKMESWTVNMRMRAAEIFQSFKKNPELAKKMMADCNVKA